MRSTRSLTNHPARPTLSLLHTVTRVTPVNPGAAQITEVGVDSGTLAQGKPLDGQTPLDRRARSAYLGALESRRGLLWRAEEPGGRRRRRGRAGAPAGLCRGQPHYRSAAHLAAAPGKRPAGAAARRN